MEPDVIKLSEIGCIQGFKEVTFAKDQPEYKPLPAITDGNKVITKWNLTDKEIKDIFDNRCIYLEMLTFGNPLQPVRISTVLEEEL